jgi:hypothetical protein
MSKTEREQLNLIVTLLRVRAELRQAEIRPVVALFFVKRALREINVAVTSVQTGAECTV